MGIGSPRDAIARGAPDRPRRIGRSHVWLGASAAVALLAGGFVLARVIVGHSWALSETYYDEALPGLMSLAILRGLPQVLYWGHPYLGAVDAYLAAAAFYLFGPSTLTLRLRVASFSALWVWAAWCIGRRVGGTCRSCQRICGRLTMRWTSRRSPSYPDGRKSLPLRFGRVAG